MTCPHYAGEGFNWGGQGFVICSANPEGFRQVLYDRRGAKKKYCLGKYPECPHFKKVEEVANGKKAD